MATPILSTLAFVSALGSGLIAGLFFAFSTSVMRALGSLPPAHGIAAMEAINVFILNPWFGVAFFGTALVCLITLERAFRTLDPDETHRARLRVEIGRLRALVRPLARIDASARGFALTSFHQRDVVVLLPPIDGDQASLLALLADGAAWSTSALALALGASQRTVQRALVELEADARVRSIGQARAQRWLAPPLTGFTTNLLLPTALELA